MRFVDGLYCKWDSLAFKSRITAKILHWYFVGTKGECWNLIYYNQYLELPFDFRSGSQIQKASFIAGFFVAHWFQWFLSVLFSSSHFFSASDIKTCFDALITFHFSKLTYHPLNIAYRPHSAVFIAIKSYLRICVLFRLCIVMPTKTSGL